MYLSFVSIAPPVSRSCADQKEPLFKAIENNPSDRNIHAESH